MACHSNPQPVPPPTPPPKKKEKKRNLQKGERLPKELGREPSSEMSLL